MCLSSISSVLRNRALQLGIWLQLNLRRVFIRSKLRRVCSLRQTKVWAKLDPGVTWQQSKIRLRPWRAEIKVTELICKALRSATLVLVQMEEEESRKQQHPRCKSWLTINFTRDQTSQLGTESTLIPLPSWTLKRSRVLLQTMRSICTKWSNNKSLCKHLLK